MAKWELAIACRDEEDLASGHKRKKEGDIIAVKPYPWNWGKKELKNHLIVVVDGMTKEEAEKLSQPLYKNDEEPTNENPALEIEAKRKYRFDFDLLKQGWKSDINLDRIRDVNDEYQPMKDVVVDSTEKVAIIKDKFKNSFKFSAKKVYG